jgi:hypothetical protein
MVLRGAQFQRFGPAGCILRTRRALSSYTATFELGQSGAVHLRQRSRMIHGQPCDSTAEIDAGILRRTRVAWREQVTYVVDLLGNHHRPRSLSGNAACVHAHALFQWQRGPTGIETRCRWIG